MEKMDKMEVTGTLKEVTNMEVFSAVCTHKNTLFLKVSKSFLI